MNDFALVTRDELWVSGPKSTLLEQRVIHGVAVERGGDIVATDRADAELLSLCTTRADAAREEFGVVRDGRVRIVTTGRRVGPVTRIDVSFTITIGHLSVVSTAQTLASDYARLVRAASMKAKQSVSYRGVPIVWRGGSAAVLLHEAIGHPAESAQQKRVSWPKWLSVHDEPAVQFDDTGNRSMNADLLAGEPPSAFRRASFSDVPLRRMTNLIVRQNGASFDLPPRRLEIDLVAGGSFDSVTDSVAVEIAAAELIDGRSRHGVAPFVINETRSAVAKAVTGAMGEPDRYPGVVCSSEGQPLVVGSFAPVMLTVFHG